MTLPRLLQILCLPSLLLNFLHFRNKHVLPFKWKKMITLTKNFLKTVAFIVAPASGNLGLLCLWVQEGSVLVPLRLCQPAPPPPPLKSSSCGPFKCIPGAQATISHLPTIVTMRCFISLALGLLALEVALAQNLREQVLDSGRPQLFTLLLEAVWSVPQTDLSPVCPG